MSHPVVQSHMSGYRRRVVAATARDANVVVKALSRWLSDPATFEAVDAVLGVGSWLFEFRHYITAYLEPPKTLEELRAAAKHPRAGT